MRICDRCNKKCKKTSYGSCVFLCKEDIVLCIECNLNRIQFDEFKFKYNLLKYLRNRQVNISFK
jgi:hypothetical protein